MGCKSDREPAGHWFGWAILAALWALPALAEPGGVTVDNSRSKDTEPPLCSSASHDRLLIRKGRDVCGGTLDSKGRPAARGYLPTICPDQQMTYRTDYIGLSDRCLRPASHREK
jgi:hypothetical protein